MSEPDFRNQDARAEAEDSAERNQTVTGPDAERVDEEALAAAEGLAVRPGVEDHYREMTERGAHQHGEGRVP